MAKYDPGGAADSGFVYPTTPVDWIWEGFRKDSDYPVHILLDDLRKPITGDKGFVAVPVLPTDPWDVWMVRLG